jgi:DNA-binding NtrC family response regulator
MIRVCLVEDDPIMGEALVQRLELEGFAVVWHRTGEEGMRALAADVADLAIIDVNLPDLCGADIFSRLLDQRVHIPPSLFMTGYGTIEDAVRLLKLGAADYLTKPLDPTALIEKLRALAGVGGARGDTQGDEPLGISASMRHLAGELARMARHVETPLLIGGESGVGKEVAARHLHRHQCPDAPFVAVNCAALPDTLIEAELFGHEKGSFTGADRRRAGVFEQAGRGILFLDEIGDMPLALQSRLLRVVQDRQLTRIGGSEPVEVPARLVCATHQDLASLVREGRFREDLYYRVRVLEIRIPPLRERPEDVLWLAERFIADYGRRVPQERRVLTPEDREHLLQRRWPGNVRELQHTLERACILGRGERLALDDARDAPGQTGLKAQAQASERAAIEAALAEQAFNMTATAARLGISRKTLWQKMKRYGVTRRS